MAYDKNVDYQALINEAVKNGDMAKAAKYETQRNEKIDGMGMTGVAKTENYRTWLTGKYGYEPNTDYQALIDEAAKNGDMARAAIYEAQRNEKINGMGLTNWKPTSKYAAWLPGETSQQYSNPWKEDLDKAIAGITDVDAYRKSYLREADKTMEDTLGKYATMTGSVPSTAAIAAASQAADNTKAQLDAKIQQLNRDNINVLLQAGSQNLTEYQQAISNAMTRWSTLGYADKEVASALGVPIGTSTADQSYQRWQQGMQEWSANLQEQQLRKEEEQEAKADAYNLVMTMISSKIDPPADLISAAGLTQEIVNALLGKSGTSENSYTGGGNYISQKNENQKNGEGEGIPNGDFSRLVSGVIEYIRSGQADGAVNLVNSNWNKLSQQQQEKVMAALN